MNRPDNPVDGLFRLMRLRPFHALRERWKEGYGWADLGADLSAGAVVALVAVPLSMALAVASGVEPRHGLYTAIIAGFLVALLGGSRFQVTGPTAAFVVILAPIASKFGLPGLLMAGTMAGLLLIVMGLARMGRVIQFVPYPVTTGFTAGIGLVIATLQLKDFFGLQPGPLPDHFIERALTLFSARGTGSWMEFAVGSVTLAGLILWPKINRRVPAPLIVLLGITVGTVLLNTYFPSFHVATIATRFPGMNGDPGGIPASLPSFVFPWRWVGPDGLFPKVTLSYVEALVPAAFAIALLGAIESLLSAVVADGMTRTRHDPDAELLALGKGNIVTAFFGGVPATGAFARTATNIRAGARSPLAAMTHAVLVAVIVLLFAPYISYLPMAAMAALLLTVAWHMAEFYRVKQLFHLAPKSDRTVFLTAFVLTVTVDMVIGVSVGIVLAALLFLRRMASHTTGRTLSHGPTPSGKNWPKDVFVYEITGPLFFGAVENAVGALRTLGGNIRSVVLLMEGVPHLDVTGLVSLESAINEILQSKKTVALVGTAPQPLRLFRKTGLIGEGNPVLTFKTLDEALTTLKS